MKENSVVVSRGSKFINEFETKIESEKKVTDHIISTFIERIMSFTETSEDK